MLCKYIGFVLRSPDANTEGDSSNSSDANGADSSQQQQDANQSDDQQDDFQGQSDDGGDSSNADDGEQEQADDQQNSQQEQSQDDQQGQQDDANVVVDKPEDKELEFHKHPRFQELIQAKNNATLEVEKQKPLVEQASALNSFLQENQISTQEFQSALQYLQALRRDPVAAFKMLQPTYEQLAQYAGEVLPGDLQAKVAAATLSLEDAKELAKSRAQTTYQNARNQWQQQSGQLQTGGLVNGAINLWVTTKMGTDPDLKQGSDLWNLVDKNIKAMPAFRNAEDAMAGCEKAYTEAKAFFKKYAPRTAPTQKKALSSRHSATGNNRVFKTAEEVARFIGNGGKPEQVRYS